MQVAQNARKLRRELRRTVVQKGGVMYAQNARRIARQKEESELAKAKRAFDRALKAEEEKTARWFKKNIPAIKRHRKALMWKAQREENGQQ